MGFTKSAIRSISLVALFVAALPAGAANVCDPTTGTSCVQVDKPASGANTAGASLNRPATKSTYGAATKTATDNGVVVAAASAAPFACIYGSATKTVILQRLFLSGGTLTAVAYNQYVVGKYSTAVSGGTATALAATPYDSNSAASSATNLNVYTAAPTAGNLVGTISAKRTLLQATVAAAAGIPDVIEFDFRTTGSETSGIYLRGTAQGVCVNFGVAPATAVTLAVRLEWTEQATTMEP